MASETVVVAAPNEAALERPQLRSNKAAMEASTAEATTQPVPLLARLQLVTRNLLERAGKQTGGGVSGFRVVARGVRRQMLRWTTFNRPERTVMALSLRD